MKESEITKIVATLAAAYPNAQITTATCGLYETQLVDLDRDAVVEAVERLIRTSRFFPTIAEIRATAAELAHGPRRLGIEAWGDVIAEIRRVGSYQRPRFDDPLVTECVRLMGWQNLCLSDNEVADRARFAELYNGVAARTRTDIIAGRRLPAPPSHPELDAGLEPPQRMRTYDDVLREEHERAERKQREAH